MPRGTTDVDVNVFVEERDNDQVIVDMMGEDDPRVERWDDLVRRFGSP